ncbi:hypothetical protein [Niabella soli]|uniref:Lipoprotein n=1 Tax=Niabella soli DSM 19437 TaxID=929713 RepID=W0EXK8_9BACT|nr:hypothetical protein [Niabella soli]AHF15507.1 hypothetical protein NIASO_10770 [Niabella soli DSM 19437]
MKAVSKFLNLMLIAVIVLVASCSKSDNPADNNLFVGKYTGSVSYTGSANISNSNGSVEVVKVGDRYDFHFSDNIPTISNVQMAKGDQGYIGTVNGYSGGLSINANKLSIALTKDGNAWGANCSR